MKWIAVSLLMLFGSIAFSQTCDGDKIVGTWLNDSGRSMIEFFKENGKYYGKTVWLAYPNDEHGVPKRDVNNPDESLRDRLLLGLVCIRDFIFSGENTYEGGTGYVPRFGKTVNGTIRLIDSQTLELSIKIAFFTKKIIWTKQG